MTIITKVIDFSSGRRVDEPRTFAMLTVASGPPLSVSTSIALWMNDGSGCMMIEDRVL